MATANSKRAKNSQDIALDKFEVDINAGRKKKSKIPKEKNLFKRFVNFLKRLAKAVIPQKGDSKADIGRKVMLLAAIAILIGTLSYLIYQLVGLRKGGDGADKLAIAANAVNSGDPSIDYVEPDRLTNPTWEIPDRPGSEEPEYIDLTPVVNVPINVDWAYLKGLNPDVRGWVKVQGTLLNNVVMGDPDGSNFYIDHDIEKNESISGEIFSSWRNRWDGSDDNIVLYGHNMASGYYFAYINHYVPNDASREPLAFYKVHPTVMLATPEGGCQTYKIFAGFLANTDENYGEVFNYTGKTNFNGPADFNSFIIDIMDRSWFYTDVDLKYGDQLLTLSTCYWPLGRSVETRYVVMARKVRPGEDEYVDTSVAERNYGAKLFEHYYNVIGSQWHGSNWDTSKLLS